MQPYLSGSGILSHLTYRVGDQYCDDVQFKFPNLHPTLPKHIFVTADLTNTKELNPQHSVAMFSTNYRSDGFTVCAAITGRKNLPLSSGIAYHWVAAQDGIIKADPGAMDIGVVEMPTWSTGSRCVFINVKHVSFIDNDYLN